MTRNEILLKIQHAENFTPHKVDYYNEMLKEFDLVTPLCTCYYPVVTYMHTGNKNCESCGKLLKAHATEKQYNDFIKYLKHEEAI